MVLLVTHRLRTHGPPDHRAGDLRTALRIAGWVTAGVVVVSTALSGLPRDRSAQPTIVLLTAAALMAWLVSLAPRVQAPPILVGCLLGMGIAGAWLSLLQPTGPGFLVSFMAMAGIGLQLPRRIALPAGGIVLVAAGLVQAHTSAQPVTAALSLATGAAFLFLAAAFAGVSRDLQAQAQELLAAQEQTRAAREEAAVLAERSRLARELHDVLAHTLAGLAVHLEAARVLALSIDGDPRLTEQVTSAQRLARDGLSDAKRAVSTLRSEHVPGPEDLAGLIEETRRRGTSITYLVAGRPTSLSGETGLAVYRTVQEALTNTAKHAGADAAVTVHLTWTEGEITVEICDRGGDGVPAVSADVPSGHYGLTGLAERAALAGGRLTTGPTADGWRVCLRLPSANASAPAPVDMR
jgi:signal transduction histidine kinase